VTRFGSSRTRSARRRQALDSRHDRRGIDPPQVRARGDAGELQHALHADARRAAHVDGGDGEARGGEQPVPAPAQQARRQHGRGDGGETAAPASHALRPGAVATACRAGRQPLPRDERAALALVAERRRRPARREEDAIHR
jgi:hypothetical protein